MGIELSSEITVKLVDSMASDLTVIRAAQVSINGEMKETNTMGEKTDPVKLINYLMKSRHGSPFEHNAFTFFVEAPLFVFREWQRHRISSFNEMSGRYSKMIPKFYTPRFNRPLVNVGSGARPEMSAEATTDDMRRTKQDQDARIASMSWREYERSIAIGLANEVARTVLPLGIYSQMYWTVNARSLMNFLSLRVDSEDSAVRSRPQLEIQYGAEQIERYFRNLMPITHEAFVKNGRIAP